MTKRTTDDLGNMFDKLVDTFTDILDKGEAVETKDGDVVRVTPKAATLATIRQFLRDQNINASPAHKGLQGLAVKATQLPFKSDEDETGDSAYTH